MKHPLEDVFNMDEGTAFNIEQQYGNGAITSPAPTDLDAAPTEPQPDIKDADDIETEKKIDAIYDSAMTTFQNQIAYTEIIEPRYAARNAEVAAAYLNIALQAATSKAKIKVDRKKVNAPFIPFGGKTTNNIVVADRNDILKFITVDNKPHEIK